MSRKIPSIQATLPVLPLAGAVLFPGEVMVVSGLDELSDQDQRRARAGRLKVAALAVAADDGRPLEERLLRIGVVARVGPLRRLPTGETGAELRGEARIRVARVTGRGGRLRAEVTAFDLRPGAGSLKASAFFHALKVAALRLAQLTPTTTEEQRQGLAAARGPAELVDRVVPFLSLTFDERKAVLLETEAAAALNRLVRLAGREEKLHRISHAIRDKATAALTEHERRTFLREQVRVMQRELGDGEGGPASDELDELAETLSDKRLPDEAREAAERELSRMALMAPGSPEYMVSHTYLTCMRDLPWGTGSKAPLPSLAVARRTLSRHHFGLAAVKERVLEYLAVMRHKGVARGNVLLLTGAPGVGKSSMAREIARALGRPFVSISLGGIRDEAEIRGHRRTYIGSMPGKIISAIRQAKSDAPVVLLDEIDKIGLDHGRSSVASALLEVLDYGLNRAFTDHYLGVPYDLSHVVFIATANGTDGIPAPLLDRMEHVELASYTDHEKVEIARRHLVPSAADELGLKGFRLDDGIVSAIIRQYTREAGVRQLKRAILTMGRKLVLAAQDGKRPGLLTPAGLPKLLGPVRYMDEPNDARLAPGVALGLAYTAVGGDILYIETSISPATDGRGRLVVTGSLGKVMKESAQAAWAYLTGLAHMQPDALAFDAKLFATSHIHLHVPSGAVPKDGPSAGLAIVLALASLLTGRPLSAKLAVTGEISLRGQVLPIGGLREKLLAAHRYGKTRVLIPLANVPDLEQIPKSALRDMEVLPVSSLAEALSFAGLSLPRAARRGAPRAAATRASFARSHDLR